MILSDRASVRVQFADIAGEIASEPDVAFLVGCETVRPRFRGLCPILTESSRPWIEPPEDARHLTRVPNCTIRRGKRVVRMRALCQHRPFCERDVRLRKRPQRSNSGDRQKTKKCGDRPGQNSSPYLKCLHGFLVKMLGGQRLNPTALARRASSLLTVTTRAHQGSLPLGLHKRPTTFPRLFCDCQRPFRPAYHSSCNPGPIRRRSDESFRTSMASCCRVL